MQRPVGFRKHPGIGRNGTFVSEQPTLPVQTAAVAPQISVGGDHPVAWNDDGYRIGAVGAADGADGPRTANGVGEFTVRDGAAGGNFPQLLPDICLKRGAARIDRNVGKGFQVPLHVSTEFFHHLAISVPFKEPGFRESPVQMFTDLPPTVFEPEAGEYVLPERQDEISDR